MTVKVGRLLHNLAAGFCLAAAACASSPKAVVVDTSPPVPADRLLLLSNSGSAMALGDPGWDQARYFLEGKTNLPFTGNVESSYTNGVKRMRAFVRQGRLEGRGVVWHENSKPMLDLDYTSGKVVRRKEWKDDGQFISDAGDTAVPASGSGDIDFATTEKRGDQVYEIKEMIVPFTGRTVEMHSNGKVARFQNFQEGNRHGLTQEWHPNGRLQFQATYSTNNPEGMVRSWHDNGKAKSELVYTGDKMTSRKEWDRSGRLIPDTSVTTVPPPSGTNAAPVGAVDFATIEKRGNLLFETSEMIVPFTGQTAEKHRNGQVARLQNFKEGLRDGLTQEWYPSGRLRFQATYIADNPEGVVTWWYDNGNKEYENTWVAGFPDLRVSYAPNGTESGRVDKDGNGRLVRFYYPSGKKKVEEEYKDNPLAPVKEIWWNENGTLQDPPEPVPPTSGNKP